MSSETTIAEPLSGFEIADAVCEELRRKLHSDCRMNPALAYEAFELEIPLVRLKLKNTGQEAVVEREGLRVAGGPQELLKDVVPVETRVELGDRPPNVVRQEAGLAIPTLTETSSGRKEIHPVKYAKQPAPEAKR